MCLDAVVDRCDYRFQTPQKCRLKSPRFGVCLPSVLPMLSPKRTWMGEVIELREIVMIHELRRQGLSVSAIAR